MKITKKFLEKIIKEEMASILLEQDPIKQKEKMIADLKAKIKAEKDAKKKKTLQAKLKKLKTQLAGPGASTDQSIEEGGGGYGAEMLQQQVANAPEVQLLKPKLEAIDGVDKVYMDDIKDSKGKPGHKLITVQLRVPAAK